jgi:hypothetical protein
MSFLGPIVVLQGAYISHVISHIITSCFMDLFLFSNLTKAISLSLHRNDSALIMENDSTMPQYE